MDKEEYKNQNIERVGNMFVEEISEHSFVKWALANKDKIKQEFHYSIVEHFKERIDILLDEQFDLDLG